MPQHEPEASPQQQEAVRRLLAEARHDGPVPAEVVARLDGVLEQLAAEGPRAIDPPPPSPHPEVVVDLNARRRRRVVTRLLGAAAAVVVVGVGVSRVADLGAGSGSDDSASSTVMAEKADRPAGETPYDLDLGDGLTAGGSDGTAESAPSAVPNAVPVQPTGAALPATVRLVPRTGFDDTAVRLRSVPSVMSSDGVRLGADDLTSAPMFVCAPTVWGVGRLVPVSYAGSPAVLVYRPPTGSTQTVELRQCGSGDVLRSTVIPFP